MMPRLPNHRNVFPTMSRRRRLKRNAALAVSPQN
jgi:hypothetical protein